jgi:hypothetical protein
LNALQNQADELARLDFPDRLSLVQRDAAQPPIAPRRPSLTRWSGIEQLNLNGLIAESFTLG